VAQCRSIRVPREVSGIGPVVRLGDGAFDGAANRRWRRHQHDLVALAADAQHAVAVLLAEVFDVAAGGPEDPQSEQAEHGDEREVAAVGRVLRGGE
jgi:hypothetical protein